MSKVEYIQGTLLPDLTLELRDDDGNLINFSGYAFTLRVGVPGQTRVLSKPSGITGTSTSPNVTIAWTAGELDTITPGAYEADLIATRNSDSKVRIARFALTVRPRIA